MRSQHHPRITMHGKCWVVECPECSAYGGQLPIGIGMPLESQLTAERLRDNHAGPQITAAREREQRTHDTATARY